MYWEIILSWPRYFVKRSNKDMSHGDVFHIWASYTFVVYCHKQNTIKIDGIITLQSIDIDCKDKIKRNMCYLFVFMKIQCIKSVEGIK